MQDRLRPSRRTSRIRPILVLAGLVASFCSAPATARVWRVAPDGSGDFSSVQAAILASTDWDEVVVDPGTYHERLWFGGKRITVRSTQGPEATIVDAGGTGSVVTMDRLEGPQTVLEGFTLRGGTGTRLSLQLDLEAMRAVPEDALPDGAPASRTGRSGEDGGSEPDTLSREFRYGGGILLLAAGPTLRDLALLGNRADYGGGIFGSVSSPRMTNCRFGRNVAGCGAGAMFEGSSLANLEGCLWTGNRAAMGGGIALLFSTITAQRCRFAMNEAGEGGALWIRGGEDPSLLDHCILWRNVAGEASALRVFDGAVEMRCCTVAGNGFPGIDLAAIHVRDGGRGKITNTIFVENTSSHAVFCSNATLSQSCNDFWPRLDPDPGCPPGAGNFTLDPLMCDHRKGNFFLRPGSPCLPGAPGTRCGQVGALGLGCSIESEENR